MKFESQNTESFEQYELWCSMVSESNLSPEIKEELLSEFDARKRGRVACLASFANILDRLYPNWVQYDAGVKRERIYGEKNINPAPEGEALIAYELFDQLRSDV